MATLSKLNGKRFNLSYFKKLPTLDQINTYISGRLPLLGTGSSRSVYAYSGSKVIKVAQNENGLLQNAAELELYTHPKSKRIVTKIYSYGQSEEEQSKVTWLVSELAQPIKTKKAFQSLSGGVDWDLFEEIIKHYASECKSLGDYAQVTNKLCTDFSSRISKSRISGYDLDANWYEGRLEALSKLIHSDLFNGIISSMEHSRLMPGDLLEVDHYGKTIDGRLVLIDYGFTEDVASKIFKDLKKKKTKASMLPPPIMDDNNLIEFPGLKTRTLPKIKIAK